MQIEISHFSPLHTDSFALTSLWIQGPEFGWGNAHDYFSFNQLNFQQFQAILGSNKRFRNSQLLQPEKESLDSYADTSTIISEIKKAS